MLDSDQHSSSEIKVFLKKMVSKICIFTLSVSIITKQRSSRTKKRNTKSKKIKKVNHKELSKKETIKKISRVEIRLRL